MWDEVLYIFFYSLFLISHPVTANPLKGDNVKMACNKEFPFVASLQTKIPYNRAGDMHICTGSLITPKHVITAEHCITSFEFKDIRVVVGTVDLNDLTSKYYVKFWLKYDEWLEDRGIEQNLKEIHDVAILFLSKPVDKKNAVPIKLTNRNNLQLQRTKGLMIGWGRTETGRLENHLRKVVVNILNPDDCTRRAFMVSNMRFDPNRSNHFCSADTPFALTTCGDSGGPIISADNTLVGINYGSCPDPTLRWGGFSEDFLNKYRVNLHLSIDYYRDFINEAIQLAV